MKFSKRAIASSLAAALLASIAAGNAAAAGDAEAEALGKVMAEIEAIKPLIAQAQQQADTGQRVTFNYEALRADLSTIELGIEKYRAGIRNQPREIEPLVGDYRR